MMIPLEGREIFYYLQDISLSGKVFLKNEGHFYL